MSEWLEGADWWDFSVPHHGVVVGRAEALEPWVLGGGYVEIPLSNWVRLSLHYIINKGHLKTISSIQVTPIVCLFIFIQIHIHSLIGFEFLEQVLCAHVSSWGFLGLSTFQLTGWLMARDECWEMLFGEVIMESFRDYRAIVPWALEQRKDLK